MLKSTICVACLATSLSAACLESGTPLPEPTDEVVLTITGDISRANGPESARFDLNMLKALGSTTYVTETVWTYGLQTFTGIPLGRIAEHVGTEADSVMAFAINDYQAEIPRDDWAEGGAIVAYLNNGLPMSVREMGPLWIIYPYDAGPDMQTESIFARSVWQLAILDFRS